jgi:hypothetical protein
MPVEPPSDGSNMPTVMPENDHKKLKAYKCKGKIREICHLLPTCNARLTLK